MSTTTRTKIVVAGGAAALTLGVAVPAVAHGADDGHRGSRGPEHHQQQPLTLAQAKAQATKLLAKEAAWLQKAKQSVAADDSDAEKATYTAKIDAALAAVSKAQTAVDDANTKAQVKAALKSASPRIAIPHPDQPTLSEQKERATTWLDGASSKLTALRAKIAADDSLTADQKSAVTARIDKELARIATAKTAVADATTVAQVRAALADAHLVPVHYPKHHARRDASTSRTSSTPTLASARTAEHSVTVTKAATRSDSKDDATTGAQNAGADGSEANGQASGDDQGRDARGDDHGDDRGRVAGGDDGAHHRGGSDHHRGGSDHHRGGRGHR